MFKKFVPEETPHTITRLQYYEYLHYVVELRTPKIFYVGPT